MGWKSGKNMIKQKGAFAQRDKEYEPHPLGLGKGMGRGGEVE